MPAPNSDKCPGCERFWRAFDALVQRTDRNLGSRILVVALATLGLCVGAIITVALFK